MTSGALPAGPSPIAPPRRDIDPWKQEVADSPSRQAPPPVHDLSWVRGPAWDSFWMLSALWLAPIAWWLALGYSDPESSPLDLLYFGLTALFWIGHRLCSTYLAYCTEAYRPLLRTQPVRFVVLPILVTVGCLAFFSRRIRRCRGRASSASLLWQLSTMPGSPGTSLRNISALSPFTAREPVELVAPRRDGSTDSSP